MHFSLNPPPQNCWDCWILRRGFPSTLNHQRWQYTALLDAGMETANEPFRVDHILAMAHERVSEEVLLHWYCFEADDGKRRWAIASSLKRGSITYGICSESCPGRSVLPPVQPRMPPMKWRGY